MVTIHNKFTNKTTKDNSIQTTIQKNIQIIIQFSTILLVDNIHYVIKKSLPSNTAFVLLNPLESDASIP